MNDVLQHMLKLLYFFLSISVSARRNLLSVYVCVFAQRCTCVLVFKTHTHANRMHDQGHSCSRCGCVARDARVMMIASRCNNFWLLIWTSFSYLRFFPQGIISHTIIFSQFTEGRELQNLLQNFELYGLGHTLQNRKDISNRKIKPVFRDMAFLNSTKRRYKKKNNK